MNITQNDQQQIQLLYEQLTAYKYYYGYFPEDYAKRNRFARFVSNTIHDMNGIWTGFISRQARDQIVKGEMTVSQCCNEHFKSRQYCGHQVIDYVDSNDVAYQQFTAFIIPMCLVHRTTSVENVTVGKYQRQELDWVQAYEAAGIELIDVGYCKSLRKERVYKHKDTEPISLQQVDEKISLLIT